MQWVCGVDETQISHVQDEPTEQLLECAPVSSKSQEIWIIVYASRLSARSLREPGIYLNIQ